MVEMMFDRTENDTVNDVFKNEKVGDVFMGGVKLGIKNWLQGGDTDYDLSANFPSRGYMKDYGKENGNSSALRDQAIRLIFKEVGLEKGVVDAILSRIEGSLSSNAGDGAPISIDTPVHVGEYDITVRVIAPLQAREVDLGSLQVVLCEKYKKEI